MTAALVARLFAPARDERAAAIRRTVRDVAVATLMGIADNRTTDAAVRAGYEDALRDLRQRLRAQPAAGAEAADRRAAADAITRFLERPGRPREPLAAPTPPPGPPIG